MSNVPDNSKDILCADGRSAFAIQIHLALILHFDFPKWMRASRQEYAKLRKKLMDNLMLARSIMANTNNNTKIRDDASKLAEKLEADIQAIDDILSGKRTEKSYWDTKPGTLTSLGSMLGRRFTKKKKVDRTRT